jgi:hypothetical protein
MATRKARVASTKRPWCVVSFPPPRDFFKIIHETHGLAIEAERHRRVTVPPDYDLLGTELFMLARQLWLFGGLSDDLRVSVLPRRTVRHVAQRRSEALHEAPLAIRKNLRVLMQFSRRKTPTPRQVGEACEAVVTWALDAGCAQIGLQFAEGAAAASPTDPYSNFLAGRTNRVAGADWRAETFYSRAIRFAHRQLAWDVYVRANLGLGPTTRGARPHQESG